MKFRKTIVLFAVFLVLLATVLFFESKGHKTKEKKEKEAKLLNLVSADILKIRLKNESGVMTFQRNEKGGWLITEPLEVQAEDGEVDSLAESLAGPQIERVVEAAPKDLETYEIPKREVTLWIKGKDVPVKILIGMENPIDNTLFAKREDENRVVLLQGSLKTNLDKKLFDFRGKEVFKFETMDVRSIKVRAGDMTWAASKKGDAWELTSPIEALASGNKVDSLLYALSGLKAKEFISEKKSDEEIKQNGLDKPEYEVRLSIPSGDKEAILSLHKKDDKIYAAGSVSDKIVLAEEAILIELEKKAEEYREKKVAVFDTWVADRISVTRGSIVVAAVKEKVKDEEKWRFETPDRAEADGSKVEAFLRKLEGLEAVEFIDTPNDLTGYGLDKPEIQLIVRVKESEDKTREISILVGREDEEKKQVVVKNSDLKYLFRVDSAFLADIPKEAKDWQTEVKPGTNADKS